MNTQNEEVNQTNNQKDTPIPHKTKKRNVMFYVKVIGVFLLLAALMFIIAAYVVFSELTKPGVIEKILTKKLSEITHTKCEFGKVDISFPNIYVRDVKIATTTELINLNSLIGEIAIRPSFAKAFKGELFIDYLAVSSSTTDLTIKKHVAKANNDVKDIKKQQTTEKSKTININHNDIPFNSISLNQIQLILNDLPAKESFDINLYNAALTYSLTNANSLPIELNAEIKDLFSIKTDGYFELEGVVDTNAELKVDNLNRIKKYIPSDYLSYIKPFTSTKANASIKYDINSEKLSVTNFVLEINPGIKANAKAELASLSPVSGKIEANLEPISAYTLSTVVSPFLPKEYKIVIKNGSVSANATIELIKDKSPIINAQITPYQMQIASSLLPENLIISNGKLVYDGKNAILSDIKANISNQLINIPSFSYGALTGNFDGKLTASSKLDEILKLASGFAGNMTKDMTLSGSASAEATIKGNASNPNIIVNGKVQNTVFSHKLIPEKISLQSADLSYKNSIASILNAKILFANQNISVPEISYETTKGKLNGQATGKINIESLWKTIKPIIGTSTAEIDMKGNSDLKVTISGTAAEPKINGNVNLIDATFFHPAVLRVVEKINGLAEFDLNGITCKNITANWGTSKATVNGTLKDYSKLITNFNFSVNPLDVTDAAGFFLKDSGYSVEGIGTGKGTVTGAIEKIKVLCEANAPTGKATVSTLEGNPPFKFPYTNLKASCEYFNKIFNISSASMEIFGGSVSADGKVFLDKDPMEFSINSNLNMIQTQEFLKENISKYQNVITGPLKGSFKATGTTAGLASLRGNADITAPEGTYSCPDAVRTIVNKIRTNIPKFADKINEEKIASGTYKNLVGNYRLENGTIISDNALANFEQGNISFSGSIGLDTVIKGNSKLTLSREACLKDDVLKKLVGDKESFVLPIAIKGTLTSPDVDVKLDNATKALLNEKKNELINKGINSLMKIINDNSQDNKATASDTAQTSAENKEKVKQDIKDKAKEAEKKLKAGLKKLFK